MIATHSSELPILEINPWHPDDTQATSLAPAMESCCDAAMSVTGHQAKRHSVSLATSLLIFREQTWEHRVLNYSRTIAAHAVSQQAVETRGNSLPPPTLSGVRTCLRRSSPRKREFLRFGLETFGKFSLRLPFLETRDFRQPREIPIKYGTFNHYGSTLSG